MLTLWLFNPLVVDVVVDDALSLAPGLAAGAHKPGTGQATLVLQTAEVGCNMLLPAKSLRRSIWVDDSTAVGPTGDTRSDITDEVIKNESQTHAVWWLSCSEVLRNLCDGFVI